VRTLIFPILTTDISFFTEYKLQGYKSVYFLIYFLLKNIWRNNENEFWIWDVKQSTQNEQMCPVIFVFLSMYVFRFTMNGFERNVVILEIMSSTFIAQSGFDQNF